MATLYAELLLNIRTIVFSLILDSESSSEAVISIAEDGKSVSAVQDDVHRTLSLPCKVINTGRVPSRGEASQRILSLRLRPEEIDFQQKVQNNHENIVPWSANDLTPGTSLHCSRCDQALLIKDRIKAWKDLPSETWAEMMEFWHCHKPPTAKNNLALDALSTKGYAASNRISAQKGIGFISPTSFLLSPSDCSSIKGEPSAGILDSQRLSCTQCQAILGIVDEKAEGWKLDKWSLAIRESGKVTSQRFDATLWISAQLLAVIEGQGTKKMLVRDADDENRSFLVWIFTPDLWFSSNPSPFCDSAPHRGMKVFYTPTSKDDVTVGGLSFLDELMFPKHIFDLFVQEIEAWKFVEPLSTAAVPDSIKSWRIALLRRFSSIYDD